MSWPAPVAEPLDILSGADFAALADGLPPAEGFGPDSARPLLAFRLDGAPRRLADWLRGLPCPVIGVGVGPLAEACDVVLPDEAALPGIAANVARTPLAAMVLVQLLRASEGLPMAEGLTAESFAYGVVQAGPEFRRWRAAHTPVPPSSAVNTPPLKMTRDADTLRLAMNRPQTLNAIGVEMRDALAEAFDLALLDDEIARVELTGVGRAFSVGGEVAEFGLSEDPATAHWVRSLRLPARRLPVLRERFVARVHGAAIGAGVEIAAFAGRFVATPDAWFQLPELKYGLIPGAGGTVNLARRIGRQRTALMVLSMRRVTAATALAWGLVDAIKPA